MPKKRKTKFEKDSNEKNEKCNHNFHMSHIFPKYNCMNDSLSIIAPNYYSIFVCEKCGYLMKKKIRFHEDEDDEEY